jgi:ATP-binding cassette subfamily B protein
MVGKEEEKKKFGGISGFIYKTFTKAEQIMAFNSPLMSLLLDGAILLIAYFGAKSSLGRTRRNSPPAD